MILLWGPSRVKKLVAPLLALLALNGCLSAVPVTPVTPENSAQVKACETDESVHNIAVLSGVGLGAVTTGLGSAGALVKDENTKTDMAISTIGTGIVAVIVTAIAGIEAADYGNSGCSTLLGPLPVAKPGDKK